MDNSKATIFVSLVFFTFETLLALGVIYLFLIPLSCFSFYKNKKNSKMSLQEEDHEDIL